MLGYQANFKGNEDAKRKPHDRKKMVEKAKLRRSWDIAKSPGKSIFMNLMMLWMVGSKPDMIPFMMIAFSVMSSVTTLLKFNSAFEAVSDGKIDLKLQRLTYLGLASVSVLVGLYKFAGMGLLPTTSVDWAWRLPEFGFLEDSIIV
eukprot:TRINITY_DN781863_c0_g1_i1.p1 TRINITY_DN781863_c0_g1~~TRINITY_DN781863_c0_g1_i1.p1  ORF type:complete len:146 (-),score=32.68 TRINITY_DN781863_c0_g1_i1:194-631(-)